MEFHEKLQELRKRRGLTQEELAQDLYVSRTAISKWESGRGYPSIDSLKEISKYFSVSIDDLLSGEKLLSIAEQENKSNLQNVCDLLFGMCDVSTFLLIILPLYPQVMTDYVSSVNLLTYTEIASVNLWIYWVLFVSLVLFGVMKLLFIKWEVQKGNLILTDVSMTVSALAVLLLAISREAYAITMIFLLLVIKGLLYLKMKDR